jgi:hypothetical protein
VTCICPDSVGTWASFATDVSIQAFIHILVTVGAYETPRAVSASENCVTRCRVASAHRCAICSPIPRKTIWSRRSSVLYLTKCDVSPWHEKPSGWSVWPSEQEHLNPSRVLMQLPWHGFNPEHSLRSKKQKNWCINSLLWGLLTQANIAILQGVSSIACTSIIVPAIVFRSITICAAYSHPILMKERINSQAELLESNFSHRVRSTLLRWYCIHKDRSRHKCMILKHRSTSADNHQVPNHIRQYL